MSGGPITSLLTQGQIVETQVSSIAHVIQLSAAPVFFLSAIAAFLNVLAQRLGRTVDRARKIEVQFDSFHTSEQHIHNKELDTLSRRGRLIGWSMTASVIAALLICLVVVALFVGAMVASPLSGLVAMLFIGALLAFVAGLVMFLTEVWLGTRSLRIHPQTMSAPSE